MDRRKLREEMSQKQERYIRLLEEELAAYKEKDRAQEELIGKLKQTLDLFGEEISRLKEEKREGTQEGG